MLPVVARDTAVAKQIVIYSWVTVLMTLALIPVAPMGWVYTTAAVLSGALFLLEAHKLQARARQDVPYAVLKPMRLFHYSISYLTLVFLGVALDPILYFALPGL